MKFADTPDWESHYRDDLDFTYAREADLNWLLTQISVSHGSALDLGCGTGQLSRELYHRGFSVAGVEASPTALSRARRSTCRDIRFRQGDLESDAFWGNFKGEVFDLIIARLVIPFIQARADLYAQIARHLGSSGSFVAINPTEDDAHWAATSTQVSSAVTASELATHFSSVQLQRPRSDRCTYFICSS